MDLANSEFQEMLRTSARDFLDEQCPITVIREMAEKNNDHSPELWKEVSKLGWTGLVIPEEYQGGGNGFVELSLLLEEMGRACFTGPFFSTTVFGALPVIDLGTDAQKGKYLPEIAGGSSIFTLALVESIDIHDANSINVSAHAVDNNGYEINGVKLMVPYADIADYLLCVARTDDRAGAEDGITLFIVDAKSQGISHKSSRNISDKKLSEVTFERVKVPTENILGERDKGWIEVQKMLGRAALANCFEMLGAMQRMLDMTVQYIKGRKRFGRPIGSFQTAQHYCTRMLIGIQGARLSCSLAAWQLSEGLPATKEIAVAKTWTNEAGEEVIRLSHQLNGSIGLCMEHDLPFFTKRVKEGHMTYGSTDYYREAIARELGL